MSTYIYRQYYTYIYIYMYIYIHIGPMSILHLGLTDASSGKELLRDTGTGLGHTEALDACLLKTR